MARGWGLQTSLRQGRAHQRVRTVTLEGELSTLFAVPPRHDAGEADAVTPIFASAESRLIVLGEQPCIVAESDETNNSNPICLGVAGE